HARVDGLAADQLIPRALEDALRGRVEVDDHAAGVPHHHALVHAVDDLSQACGGKRMVAGLRPGECSRRAHAPCIGRNEDLHDPLRAIVARVPEAAARAILLTGTVGSGKTAVAIEIGERLDQAGHAYALVDLDWLGWVRPSPTSRRSQRSILAENLRLIWLT